MLPDTLSLVCDSTQCFCVWASSVLFSAPSLGGPWDPHRDPSSVVRKEGWLLATWLARGQAGSVTDKGTGHPGSPTGLGAPGCKPQPQASLEGRQRFTPIKVEETFKRAINSLHNKSLGQSRIKPSTALCVKSKPMHCISVQHAV